MSFGPESILNNTFNYIDTIGTGGFGRAYLAKTKKDDKKVVIKEIDLSKMDKKMKEYIVREGFLLSLLEHPNIIDFKEYYYTRKIAYITMDYADGGDLDMKIKKQKKIDEKFPEEFVIQWFLEICEAIKYIHDQGVVHRDLKPKNIFLTEDGHVKLGDLGIAKDLSNEIKRIKYEMDLKKQAIEEYKDNIKMQKCGIDFTMANLKTYRDNLENNFLTKYNDNLRKLERELFEQKLKSDQQNNELLLLIKEVSSLKSLITKKENILKNIEKWLHLQIYIKEGVDPKDLKQSLQKYNNNLIFNSLEELNNALIHKENRNLRLIEKYNKNQKEKDNYVTQFLEHEKEAENMDQNIDIIIEQKEKILSQLKTRNNNLLMTINGLNNEKNISQKNKINKRSKSVNNKRKKRRSRKIKKKK